MNNAAVDRELSRRAKEQLSRRHLLVDYYRVRRRLVFPLPTLQRPTFEFALIAGLEEYPWEIWFLWELEERLNTLGWTAQRERLEGKGWSGAAWARTAAETELAAVAGWPTFEGTWPILSSRHWHGLSVGHYARILCGALLHWQWVSPDLRKTIEGALAGHVALALPWLGRIYEGVLTPSVTVAELAARSDAEKLVHNIKVIALLGYAMSANAIDAPQAAELNACTATIVKLLMSLRDRGVSEAAGYDGYTLDFITNWLETLEPSRRDAILDDPQLQSIFHESLYLSAPGDVTAVAELSDVEPRQMPFHITAQARLQKWRPLPQRTWYLRRCDPGRLRADGLACLRDLDDAAAETLPPSGVLDAQYARVLRSGWTSRDLAVAVAASTSWHGHIHDDYGSICIGTQGQWILTDPGYQQYRESSEREFTLGPKSHNAPLVNQQHMTEKAGRVLESGQEGDGLWRLRLDLTDCYPDSAGVSSVMRSVWLIGSKVVVVADCVRGQKIEKLDYYWHANPQSGWMVPIQHRYPEGSNGSEDTAATAAAICPPGAAMIYLPPSELWVASPQHPAPNAADIQRLRGSRGHQTLAATVKPAPVVWWIFTLGKAPASYKLSKDGQQLKVLGKTLIALPQPQESLDQSCVTNGLLATKLA